MSFRTNSERSDKVVLVLGGVQAVYMLLGLGPGLIAVGLLALVMPDAYR